MPLTLTVAQLAAAVRITTDPTVAPPEPVLSLLHMLLRVAESRIEQHAPNAPDDTKNFAAVTMVGYLYDMPPASRGMAYATSFDNSGAKHLLATFRDFTSAVVDGAGAPAVATPETGLNPSHPVHTGTHYRYAGWSDNGVIDQAELDAATQFTSDALTVPNRATSGYFFFGVDEDPGYPDSILLDGNQTNQIQAYLEQVARLTRESNTVIIGVTASDQSAALSGRTLTLGYASP